MSFPDFPIVVLPTADVTTMEEHFPLSDARWDASNLSSYYVMNTNDGEVLGFVGIRPIAHKGKRVQVWGYQTMNMAFPEEDPETITSMTDAVDALATTYFLSEALDDGEDDSPLV